MISAPPYDGRSTLMGSVRLNSDRQPFTTNCSASHTELAPVTLLVTRSISRCSGHRRFDKILPRRVPVRLAIAIKATVQNASDAERWRVPRTALQLLQHRVLARATSATPPLIGESTQTPKIAPCPCSCHAAAIRTSTPTSPAARPGVGEWDVNPGRSATVGQEQAPEAPHGICSQFPIDGDATPWRRPRQRSPSSRFHAGQIAAQKLRVRPLRRDDGPTLRHAYPLVAALIILVR